MKKAILLIILISIFLPTTFFSQAREPIRIGVFADMSGQTAAFGEAMYSGIKLAVEEINEAGGIDGRKMKIFLEDDTGRPETAKLVVQKLIEEKKVEIILGEVASSNSLAAAPVAQLANIPMITPSSTNPKVTEVGDFIFRTCFIDPFQGEAMARFAFNELKARRVAIFGDANSDYSKGLTDNFTRTFTKLGGKIIAQQAYAQWNDDFKEQLEKIRRSNPDAIYLPGYYAEAGEIVKLARQMNMKMPILGGDGWDLSEIWKIGGDALNDTYITNHFSVDIPTPKVQEFVKKYKTRYNHDPDLLAAMAYDAVYVLADSIRRAKTTEGVALRDAIAGTRNFSGVTGKIVQIDKNRNAIKSALILKLKPSAAKFVYQSTIEP